MEAAVQLEVPELGEAAFAAGGDVVDVAPCGRDVAAGRGTVPVAGDDGAAQVRGDGVGAGPGVQGQADGGGGAGEGAGAEQGGEPAWAREQGDGVGGDEVADRGPVRGAAGEPVGELVEEVGVEPAGDDGGDRCVAFLAGRRDWSGQARLGSTRARVAVEAPDEFVEADVELDLDGLAGPVGQAVRGDQEPAGFLEGVVVALGLGAGVFGAGFLAQGVQDGLQGGGGLGGEVGVEAAGAVQGGL
ncbi:MAG TPA: hypothetical protein VMR14_07070, partial [Streptosporangiaceae bacterium]|nr:hypothetical protein [Streptosporangiaceae bacterium]